MAGTGGAATMDLGSFRAGGGFDAEGFRAALSAFCEPLCWECTPPFLVGWYNRMRAETAGGAQAIDAPDSTVAFALYSVAGFLDVVVEHFARARPDKDYVDACTNEILAWIGERLHPDLDPMIINTDAGPPYYHVQTVGAVARADQHMEAADLCEEGDDAWREDLSDRLEDSRDPKMWGTDPETRRKIFGVNVHPVWGGWYAYRALVVLRGATAEQLAKPEALNFLQPAEARRALEEYNLRHEQCHWRDLSADGHPPERRYKPEEYLFFMETSPAKRRRFLEIRAASYASPPEPRVS
mmetsp:Transcript_29506/g.81035  ORF Transcript_29506/g.81035 Transcript_29506/m.81035 type:complete len:297 (-) Transcript_29506:76-966(-)